MPEKKDQPRTLIHVVANLQGPGVTEELMGRDYLVVPAVLVKSQVLNNNLGASFLPEEVFTTAWAEMANMAPVLIGDHPTKRGRHISAKAPDILNGRGAGFLFRTQAGNGELKADVFLDPERADDVKGLAEVLNMLEEGETVELSTGFAVSVEEKAGVANGEDFDLIIYPAGFDHLVVFADGGVGACSVDDGCGLGTNQEEVTVSDGEVAEPAAAKEQVHSGMMGIARSAWDKVTSLLFPARNESDEDRRRMIQTELNQAFGSKDGSIWVEAVFSDDNQVVYEKYGTEGEEGLFQVSYELGEDGSVTLGDPFEVRRVTTFEPVTNSEEIVNLVAMEAGDEKHPKREDAVMTDRQKRIDQLSGGCEQKRAVFEKLADEELALLAESLNAEPPQGGDEEPDTGAEVSPEGEVAEVASETPDPMAEVKAMIETLGTAVAGLQAAAAPAIEEQATQKASLVAELAGNDRVPFDKAELEGKPFEELRKIQAMSRGTNYSLRGGPKAVEPAVQEAFVAHRPYWATQEKPQAEEGVN